MKWGFLYMNKFKVGFVGATQENFGGGFAGGKEKLFDKCIEDLKVISVKLGFDLYIYPEFLVTGDDAIKAKKVLKLKE